MSKADVGFVIVAQRPGTLLGPYVGINIDISEFLEVVFELLRDVCECQLLSFRYALLLLHVYTMLFTEDSENSYHCSPCFGMPQRDQADCLMRRQDMIRGQAFLDLGCKDCTATWWKSTLAGEYGNALADVHEYLRLLRVPENPAFAALSWRLICHCYQANMACRRYRGGPQRQSCRIHGLAPTPYFGTARTAANCDRTDKKHGEHLSLAQAPKRGNF